MLAASLDADPAVSAESIIQKFRIRWKLFAACAVIAPAIAMSLACLVPTTYKCTAQVLIRHQGGEYDLYQEFVPRLPLLSGATTAEIMRSGPVASQMIESVGVENTDIARPAYKVLFGKAAALIMPLFGGETEDVAAMKDPKLKGLFLASELKSSIEANTLMVEHGGSLTPDELIEVTVKSTNREKVAAMVNGLCETFIAEYNRRAGEEIAAAKKALAEPAAKTEQDIARLRALLASGAEEDAQLSESSANTPLAEGLAKTISDLEIELVQLRQTYTENAAHVVQAKAELARARGMLSNQEALDTAKEVLSALKRKQRELGLAAQLFETNQSGLSIDEMGLTPKKSKLIAVLHYGIPGGVGLAGGIFIGVVSLLILDLLDPRLFVAHDAMSATGLPLLGVIPADSAALPGSPEQVAEFPRSGARTALLQALGKLDVLARDASRILVVTSAEDEASSATVALQLASLVARDRDSRVLLVDANFDRPDLTRVFNADKDAGLLDVLDGQSDLAAAIRPTKLARLSFIGMGRPDLRDEAGSTRQGWESFIEQCQKGQNTIIVHAGGLLNSREAAPLAQRADRPLLVTNRQDSKRNSLARAAALLAEIGVPALGIIHCDSRA
jgi:Mrp family chromosome partitioning ATPase/capsular polysaccharide biosynthesis protein